MPCLSFAVHTRLFRIRCRVDSSRPCCWTGLECLAAALHGSAAGLLALSIQLAGQGLEDGGRCLLLPSAVGKWFLDRRSVSLYNFHRDCRLPGDCPSSPAWMLQHPGGLFLFCHALSVTPAC